MSKYCSKCGNSVEENASFCDKCGNPVNASEGGTTIVNNIYNTSSSKVTNRNIVMSIVFSLITCGVYGFYWICTMTDDANLVSGETNDTSGAMVILFSLITCGIYLFYWNYKMGKKLYEAGVKNGVSSISDNSIVYLLLSIFGCSIVSYCLIQNDLNKFS